MSAALVYPALYTALAGNLAWTVYDEPPEGTDPPYITLGDPIETPWNFFGQIGKTDVVRIEGHTDYAGGQEVYAMLAALQALLDGKTFALTGGSVMHRCAFDSAQIVRETDVANKQKTRRVIALFRIDVEA